MQAMQFGKPLAQVITYLVIPDNSCIKYGKDNGYTLAISELVIAKAQ